jgi:hypothetical protein
MKKNLLLAVALVSTIARAQISTLAKSYYTGTVTPGGKIIRAVSIGNRIFTANTESNSLYVQKSDLDGVPVMQRHYNNYSLSLSNQDFDINTLNGIIYISGSRLVTTGTVSATRPFLVALDTTNLNPIYTWDYIVTGFNLIRINDSKIMNNNFLVLAGEAANTGTNPASCGILLNINLNANGNVSANSTTLVVPGSTVNAITSITEISSKTIVYTMSNISGTSFGAISKSALGFTVNSAYTTAVPGLQVMTYGNAKKVLFYNTTGAYKIDTTFSGLVTWFGLTLPTANVTKFMGGNIYRSNPAAKTLYVCDTTLNTITTNTYGVTFAGALSSVQVGQDFTRSNQGSVYLYSSENQTTNYYFMIKAQPFGQMTCAQTQTINSTTTLINGGLQTYSTGIVGTTFNGSNPVAIPAASAYTNVCTTTGLTEGSKDLAFKLVRLDNGVYKMVTSSEIIYAAIYDLAGRKLDVITNQAEELSIDLTGLRTGIYILKVKDANGSERRMKLTN